MGGAKLGGKLGWHLIRSDTIRRRRIGVAGPACLGIWHAFPPDSPGCALVDKLNSMAPRTLVIAGDPELAEVIQHTLENEGHQVLLATSYGEGSKYLEQAKPDLLIISDEPQQYHPGFSLDGLTSQDAPPVVRIIQEAKARSGRWGCQGDKDAWLVKPFSTHELSSVVRLVHLRRSRTLLEKLENMAEPYQDGRLSLDFAHRRCVIYGKEIHLSPTEYRLLAVLVSRANEIVSQRQLLATVWGPEYLTTASGDIVRQAVRAVRMKLRRYAISAELIGTVRSQGYTYRSVS